MSIIDTLVNTIVMVGLTLLIPVSMIVSVAIKLNGGF